MSDNAGCRNNGTVDQLLLEAELDDDGALRPVLLELHALGANPPQPSAAVAALMGMPASRLSAAPSADAAGDAVPATTEAAQAAATAAASSGPGTATDELAARRRAKRRIALTTLSVAVSLAAGGAVAAASDQGIRDSFGQLNQAVSSFVSTMGGGPAANPVESPAPVPTRPGASTSVPVPADQVSPAPTATATEAAHGAQQHPAPASSAPATLPKLPVPDNLNPAVPGGPLHSDGKTPALPLPATPPVPLPLHGQ